MLESGQRSLGAVSFTKARFSVQPILVKLLAENICMETYLTREYIFRLSIFLDFFSTFGF